METAAAKCSFNKNQCATFRSSPFVLSAADAMTLYEEDLVDSEILYGTVVEVVQEKKNGQKSLS